MADYAIYGKVSNHDNRLVIINESDWSVEKDISPMPLTDSGDFETGNEYWTETTPGKKLVFVRDPEGVVTAEGNVDAVLYWTETLDNTKWENWTAVSGTNQQYGVNWSWDGSKWDATNSGGSDVVVYLKSINTWTDNYRPAYFKVSLQYSGTPPTGDIGAFGAGDSDGLGGMVASFTNGGLTRTNMGLTQIQQADYDIERIGFVVPAGQTVSITGVWFSTQLTGS